MLTQYYGLALVALAPHISAHGVITCIYGDNNVTMPGLTVVDGTPRDCTTPTCGAQSDTAIYRGSNPLGMLLSGAPVDPTKNFKLFMFEDDTDTSTGDDNGTSDGNNPSGNKNPAENSDTMKTPTGTKETMVAETRGDGASSGLPTPDEDGVLTLSLHQVNEDGAGPYTAFVDSTSGGVSAAAFKPATVLQNIAGVASISKTTTTDFALLIQVPQGTVCSATIAGIKNVCIVKVTNAAPNGPFGGSAAFTQTSAVRKRALEYQRIKQSRVARTEELA